MSYRALDADQIERTVERLEQLTTGLSRKIWQKLTVLYALPPVEPATDPAPARVLPVAPPAPAPR